MSEPTQQHPQVMGSLRRRYWAAALLIVAVIIYGSLFPFQFISQPPATSAVSYLLSTWRVWDGRGDLLSNILLYMPLGFFICLGINARRSPLARVAGSMPFGIALSVCMELSQYHDAGRVTSMGDVDANAIGTLFGAVCGAILDGRLRWTLIVRLRERPDAALLLAAFVGYKLYPYVPVIDLHKYWHAVRPLLLAPAFPAFDLARYWVLWLLVAALLETIYGRLWGQWLVPLFTAGIFAGKILVVDAALVPSEVAAAALAWLAWRLWPAGPASRFLLVALMNAAMLIILRLQPFKLSPVQLRPFDMVPFWSFMHGSMNVAIQAFFEKFFQYGGLLWVLTQAGLPNPAATAGVAVLLLLTSFAETFLPGRSGELTDAIMALLIGVMFHGLQIPPGANRIPTARTSPTAG